MALLPLVNNQHPTKLIHGEHLVQVTNWDAERDREREKARHACSLRGVFLLFEFGSSRGVSHRFRRGVIRALPDVRRRRRFVELRARRDVRNGAASVNATESRWPRPGTERRGKTHNIWYCETTIKSKIEKMVLRTVVEKLRKKSRIEMVMIPRWRHEKHLILYRSNIAWDWYSGCG